MKTYIVHWTTKVNSFPSRGGYCVITAADNAGARRSLRGNLALFKGETLRIDSVQRNVGAEWHHLG